MKKYKLDKEEKEILKAFESGKLKRVRNFKQAKKEAMEIARNTILHRFTV